jgi:hypothetical protein
MEVTRSSEGFRDPLADDQVDDDAS